jgi:hypothetical protein
MTPAVPTVVIPSLPDIDVIDYLPGMDFNYPLVNPSAIALLIDKAKLWRFSVDKVMNHQSHIDWLDKTAAHATEISKRNVERAFLADIYSSAHADNLGATAGKISQNINLGVAATPVQWTATNAIELITRCRLALDEQDAPESGRWLVISKWMQQKLSLSE